ncbi:MAG: YeeE/YedE family protein [Pseudomonadota bacterium]
MSGRSDAAAPRAQTGPLLAAGAALLAIALLAADQGGARPALATLIGGVAGLALYHAGFGFTAAWRRIVRERRGAGLRAQMLLIFLACCLSFPLMDGWLAPWGLTMSGWILPLGAASAFGAFLFGAGMQLGGGCASGTLFTAGGGSVRMGVTLAAFVAGSVWATAHWDVWAALPRMGGGSLLRMTGGPAPALAAMAALTGGLWALSAWVERRAHGALEVPRRTGSWLHGPWSLAAGALALVLVCWATFAVLGRPWGVTSAFALWGAKVAAAGGVEVQAWTYWSGWRAGALQRSVFADATSVMNLGIVAGAMAAAALAGKWRPSARLSARDLATAVIGGLAMGYGARLAYGCNIGAYLGGLVSGSLHGIWWLVWGFAGSALGVYARGLLAMDPPLAPRPAV